jgi:hypothetical protein
MLRKLKHLAFSVAVGSALLASPSLAHADDVIEPYPVTPPPPLVTAPPVVAQPVPVVPAAPPPGYEYPPPQYPPPQQPYYPPPTYYQQQPTYALQPPARFRTVEQPRYGLMTAGLVVFGASWSINAISGYMADEWRVAVPLVGPLLYAHNIDTSDDFATRTAVTFLVLDALVETAGAAMFLAGALTHHSVRVMEHAKVLVVPTAGIASAGVAAVGRF